MFLLIRDQRSNPGRKLQQFTFHNVSINTVLQHRSTVLAVTFTFHNVSINTIKAITLTNTVNEFTFHNVSINTEEGTTFQQMQQNLHSTMFLLIRWHIQKKIVFALWFTFHNVSINTMIQIAGISVLDPNLHSTMFLLIQQRLKREQSHTAIYIPQCFY